MGRWTAKNLLINNSYTNLDLKDIEVRKGTNRAPVVWIDNLESPYGVSISHSHDIGFCVTSKKDILFGCDVEKIEKRSKNFITDYFTERERSLYETRYKDIFQEHEFYSLCWSSKEAVLKALGTGLSTHPLKLELEKIALTKQYWNKILLRFLPENKLFFISWREKNSFVYAIASSLEKQIKG